MRGTMLWFNGEKNRGLIEAEDGERLPVEGHAFAVGASLPERCRGTVVSFSVVDGDVRMASDVTLVPDVVPRRARRRHSSMR